MLTVENLHETLMNENHLGWGYATLAGLSESKQRKLDRYIVRVANEVGCTEEELFFWSNSKYPRWLGDEAHGETPTVALVRHYLTRQIIDRLVADERLYEEA